MTGLLISLAHGAVTHGGVEATGWEVVVLAGAAGLLPFMAGLWLADSAHRGEIVEGFAAGVLLFLFIDFVSLTGNLGMGITSLTTRAGLVLAFAAGLLLPSWGRLAPAWAWAVGVAMHSLGEGVIMGYNLHQGLGVALRLFPLISFTLHKVAEGWVAGLLPGAGSGWLMGVVVAVPAVAGALGGWAGAPGIIANFAYAAGAGVLAGTLPRLQAPLTLRRAAASALGVAIMYVAGGLHEL